MEIAFVIIAISLFLLLNEWWWRGRSHGEMSRKSVHMVVGTFAAIWPLFLTWRQIELLSVAFMVGVALSRQFNVFKAIHAVQRPTWGELYFGASVGLIALTTHQPAIYGAALLHMSLADGLAAVIGSSRGHRTTYHLFGAKKSRVGTMVFLVVSLIILLSYSVSTGVNLGLWLPLIVAGATLLENVAVKGLDNLLVPLFVALMLGIAR